MRPLDRLRLRLTGWYAATFAAILAALGFGLFFVIERQMGAELDRTLERTVAAAARTVAEAAEQWRDVDATSPSAAAVRAMRRLRLPERTLYLFDGTGRLLAPDTASGWVRAAAEGARREGRAALQAYLGREHTLRVRAERFASPAGMTWIIAAATDTEELEDQYTALIAAFAVAAFAALALVAAGGAFLARKSSAPVEAAFEHMQRFVADAAHELRTPVFVIRARADVALATGDEPHDYPTALGCIREEAERLSGILDDLLTLARADGGEQSAALVPLFLDDLALDAVSAARALAERKGVRLEVTAFGEAAIRGDATLVRQLLLIVLDNAIKYTPPGNRVTLAVAAADGRATVIIEDSGIGIAADALPHVFERFFRADPSRRRTEDGRSDGAGLGLAIARSIADAHDAEIGITSTPGRGTTVRLSFPHTG